MNNKVLFIIAVVVAIGAGWFFGNNTKVEPPIKVETPEIDYEATEIKAVQTNDSGKTEYELNAQSLNHNTQTNKDELIDVTMDWEPTDDKKYQLTSGSTDFNQETGEMTMTKGFKLISSQKSKNGKQMEPIVIVGESLKANTKMKRVSTNQPIRFKQGDNQFTASGMIANLETGDYEFTGIEVKFTPSERKDQPLF